MDVIDDAMQLNHALVNQPFATDQPSPSSCATTCSTTGTRCATASRRCCARRRCWSRSTAPRKPYDDFQKWCREIVWWGNKKGAYLYSPTAREITPELAGHY